MREKHNTKCSICGMQMDFSSPFFVCPRCSERVFPSEFGFDPCQICGDPLAEVIEASTEKVDVRCPKCGMYRCKPPHVMGFLKKLPRHVVAGVTRNHTESTASCFELTPDNTKNIDCFRMRSPYPIPEQSDIPAKAELFLRHLQRKTSYPGESVVVNLSCDFPIAFCSCQNELDFCIAYLVEQHFVESIPPGAFGGLPEYRITAEGWGHLSGVDCEVKDQGFVAMAFRLPTSDDLFKFGIFPGINNAGYKPLRIDKKEHINRVDDEIMAEIRVSRFVVADLTGKNAGAYFEAGFAMGLGKPVIWTCSQKDLDDPNGIHFDTRQYCIVPWEPDKYEDFATRLTLRIEATIGHGSVARESPNDNMKAPKSDTRC